MVHRSPQPAFTKFTYLQSQLDSEEAACIQGLALTDANYEVARLQLEKQYGRAERIIFGHITGLLQMAVPVRTTRDLWSLHDRIQAHVRSLEGLGIASDRYGVILYFDGSSVLSICRLSFFFYL